ncbi:serine hydrolase domain-containing protein [Sphingobium algorifonticola]|nr:beta-lactamase family protein [Sphingobium algorifonticola]
MSTTAAAMSLTIDRRSLLRGATLLGAGAAFPLAALARTPAESWPGLQGLIDGYVAQRRFAGGVIAVGRGTAAPDYLSGGTIASDSPVKADPDTLWRIYSMSKPITGMAAMILIGEGKLRLDQPIADFIPGFASMRVLTSPDSSLDAVPAKAQITVRHLMTHTAGLGYTIVTTGPLLAEYQRLGLYAFIASRAPLPGQPPMVHAPSLKDFADRLATLPLVAEPGTRWSYSVGLDVLGRVIEVASGQPFDAFLQSRIFDPLKMTSTGFTVTKDNAARLATNYYHAGPVTLPVDPGATSIFLDPPPFPFGGAGLISSARDYDRFLAMLVGLGTLDGTTIMAPETARLGMSNLLPPVVPTDTAMLKGRGFGAGGRVTLTGPGTGSFGWAGAAGTVGFADPVRQVRAGGYANYMPAESIRWQADVPAAVYKALA